MTITPWLLLTTSWRDLLPAHWHVAAEVAVSYICGIIIGSERERREKPAGLRALTLVCLGATFYTQLGFYFEPDAGKVVAQIVSGVGFLGAGVIMRGSGGMIGITTAASIWVTAAIGATAGAGYGGAAFCLSVLVRFVLTGMLFWQHHLTGGLHASIVELCADPNHGKTRLHLSKILDDFHIPWTAVHVVEETEESLQLRISFHLLHYHRGEFLEALANLQVVKRIKEVSSVE